MNETNVYQSLHSYSQPVFSPYEPQKPKRGVSRLKRAAVIFAFVGLFMLVSPYIASFVYSATSGVKGNNSSNSIVSVASSEQDRLENLVIHQKTLPPIDSTLPIVPILEIPRIGVDTQIYQVSLDRHEEALKKGVWMPLDFGTPSSDQPVILAAHRFGYLAWTNAFRHKNSFYNLPKLTKGDSVEIYWHQRRYTYKVYKIEEGTEVTDYGADLILYTCKDLVSDIRIFVYARLGS